MKKLITVLVFILTAVCAVSILNHYIVNKRARASEPAPWKFDPSLDYIIKTRKVKRVKARLSVNISKPSMNVTEWILLTPKPPSHETQSLVNYQAFLGGSADGASIVNELSPAKREMFLERVKTDPQTCHNIDFAVEYQLDLYARELVPGKYDQPVEELDEASRNLYLRASKTVDWDSDEFKSWLKETPGMVKNGSDKDIVFAYNVYRYITEKGTYSTESFVHSHSQPSIICRTLTGDCGGFALLFTAVLRANGIPARALVGRWAVSGPQTHVKAEFWAKGIGWVPVDLTSGFKNGDKFFGRDYGDFITFHTDTDIVVDTIYWGQSEFWGSQGWLYWITVNGGSDSGQSYKENWSVETVK